jgi:S-adenosylmethionine:tRNA ribosyltransferase-isomerase
VNYRHKIIDQYDYILPPGAIAQRPARPRDAARLLVYDRRNGGIKLGRFADLDRFLPKGSVLVINDTKVVPARLIAVKSSGGKVELFYVGRSGRLLRVLANRRLEIGAKLGVGRHSFTVVGNEGKCFLVEPSFSAKNIHSFLQKHGRTPLPPYLKRSPLSESARRREYQTVFADRKGSVAAPTASLHFTKRLFSRLKKRGIGIVRVTLHVNLGTFAPLTPLELKSGKLHSEEYEIRPSAALRLLAAKRSGKKIIAVGTTVCRTLESAASGGGLRRLSGKTQIFIRPPYKAKFADGLITNFHVPRSSLLMLVAALVGRKKLFELYSYALKEKMRFLSFGDAMLVL